MPLPSLLQTQPDRGHRGSSALASLEAALCGAWIPGLRAGCSRQASFQRLCCIQSCLRARPASSGGMHGSCLVSAWSYRAPSHCTPLLSRVPLVAGMEHLSMPLGLLYLLCPQPGTSPSSAFCQQTPSVPLVSDQTFPASGLFFFFYSRAVFPCRPTIRTHSTLHGLCLPRVSLL